MLADPRAGRPEGRAQGTRSHRAFPFSRSSSVTHRPCFLTVREIYPFRIALDPCCNVFKKGHRIRVGISSSNFPRFDVNSNTGEPLNDYRRMITAVNTIRHDRQHPSHILSPRRPARRPSTPAPTHQYLAHSASDSATVANP